MAVSDDDAVIQLLRELTAWARFQNRDALRRALTDMLSTENDLTIYELTDGTRSGAEIARLVGVTPSAVSHKWKAWRQAALITDDGDEGPRHLASVESLGGLVETNE
jgi:hypothetical protein